jgi:ubiquitin-protein ligase
MSVFISKETLKRLVSDVKNIKKDSLESEGIFYIHDDEDMLKGYAMIIGPENTPYFGGYYLFEFSFPTNYPFSPPSLTYETNNGNIRFHPNLYINGKVCLSILNTWEGEKWSSIQTIRSILLTLQSILTTDPLLNEPGIRETHKDIKSYNEIISYVNINTAIIDIVNKKIMLPKYEIFYENILKHFHKNKEQIMLFIKEKQNTYPSSISFKTYVYNLRQDINYNSLEEKINLLYNITII